MNPARYEYVRDPAEIYRQSFETVQRETDLRHIPDDWADIAIRLVHATGTPDIVADLTASPGAGAAGRAALRDGAPILCDVEMVAHGITRVRLPRQNPVLCMLNDDATPGLATKLGTTRSAAAVELWKPSLAGAVIAIGNAPTALFHLLERLSDGWPRPALVLGFPVGFIGAAESKTALIENTLGVPFIAIKGRRGGSAMAAAAINALARLEPDS
jgi:precorrin-8X/cobalt-precorrin-8 methylmutase